MARKPSVFRADFFVTDGEEQHTVKVAVKNKFVNVGATGEITVESWNKLVEHVRTMIDQNAK